MEQSILDKADLPYHKQQEQGYRTTFDSAQDSHDCMYLQQHSLSATAPQLLVLLSNLLKLSRFSDNFLLSFATFFSWPACGHHTGPLDFC